MSITKRGASYGTTIGDQAFTVSTSVVTLTVPTAAVSALITVGEDAIRFRTTGTDPTSTVGHKAVANAAIEVFHDDMDSIEFILDTGAGGDSVCFVTYFSD